MVKGSDKQIGDFFGDKEIAFGQLRVTLFKHEKSLPDGCALASGQSLQKILILPNGFPKQPESDFLSTSLTKHHKASHPHLINVDVQQLPAYIVPLVVEVEKGPVVPEHVYLLQPIYPHIYLRLFSISMLSIEESGSRVSMYSSYLYFSSRIRETKW